MEKSDFYVWEPIATYVKPKELYTGNEKQKRHMGEWIFSEWKAKRLSKGKERPKDFLKRKKGQNDIYTKRILKRPIHVE